MLKLFTTSISTINHFFKFPQGLEYVKDLKISKLNMET